MDGINDGLDLCPGTTDYASVDGDGCSDLQRDDDFDGFSEDSGDCDDDSSAVYPGAAEICADGIDNDCDGAIDSVDGDCSGGGTADTDGDGLSDTLEQTTGVTLSADLTLLSRDGSPVPGDGRHLPPCTGTLAPDDPARALCVDWATPDLFVIAERPAGCAAADCFPFYDNDASGTAESNLPMAPAYSGASDPPYFDPFAVISAPQGASNRGGLGIAVHECIQDASSTDQHIAEDAYAVRVREDLSMGSYLGLSTPGVPGPNTALTIWTEKIKQSIFEKCTTVTVSGTTYNVDICEDAASGLSITMPEVVPSYEDSHTILRPFYIDYIQNILSHELGHTVNLIPDQLHFASGSRVLMEIRIDADVTVRKNGTVKSILYITRDYHSESKAGFQLK
jgi:hypothetical protein